jgi:hypothetical protein
MVKTVYTASQTFYYNLFRVLKRMEKCILMERNRKIILFDCLTKERSEIHAVPSLILQFLRQGFE